MQLGECQRRLVLQVGHQLNYEELYYTLVAAADSQIVRHLLEEGLHIHKHEPFYLVVVYRVHLIFNCYNFPLISVHCCKRTLSLECFAHD